MLILPKYSDSDEKYCDIVKGEMKIINEEIELFNQAHYTTNLNVSDFLECVNHHLASIEQKIGKNSIEYINLSTNIIAKTKCAKNKNEMCKNFLFHSIHQATTLCGRLFV